MAFVIPPIAPPSVAVSGGSLRFPVRRIFCVGRNYADHAREMGNDPDREPPFFFTKPADAVVPGEATITYPTQTANLHHEAELVVAIGTGGAAIPADKAMGHVWGFAVGNDLTRRDMQNDAKAMRRPWDLSKGFDDSAVIGALHPRSETGPMDRGKITLAVNGTLRQQGDLADMIWPVADVIAFLSQSVALAPGDLIMTGTPAGVGALEPGDLCTASIDGLGSIATRIAPRPV
ncbi:fumarylacetoacetate hydrolase [Salipiger aestuarii]|uniref:Fumarylpyruvate hydrolase n=1 Tax=Salipiger aestuarii TaxID=568098 RepID=A0A327YS31_9RHOB|nr:fumarylacetoacetate hydrolase family protein [Salipiger aestuarii]EIE49562.1 fumarylacetoacetate hydrolase family protein [Citreicella sp. 357]KAA8610147.1 fumarylacetoacetate hydrolase [Salipiger aestuarii]KAB2543346.1 fumarylacetoacetate hydrolase [Salipiger aestuarii]RAK23984.1 fumarylpyruvate hydrolase [Salipiger aestuarii]